MICQVVRTKKIERMMDISGNKIEDHRKHFNAKTRTKEQERQSQNTAFCHSIIGNLYPYFIPNKTGLTF
jgi:hypothetical protein